MELALVLGWGCADVEGCTGAGVFVEEEAACAFLLD